MPTRLANRRSRKKGRTMRKKRPISRRRRKVRRKRRTKRGGVLPGQGSGVERMETDASISISHVPRKATKRGFKKSTLKLGQQLRARALARELGYSDEAIDRLKEGLKRGDDDAITEFNRILTEAKAASSRTKRMQDMLASEASHARMDMSAMGAALPAEMDMSNVAAALPSANSQ